MGRESKPPSEARVTVRTPTAPDRWSPGQRLQDVPPKRGRLCEALQVRLWLQLQAAPTRLPDSVPEDRRLSHS